MHLIKGKITVWIICSSRGAWICICVRAVSVGAETDGGGGDSRKNKTFNWAFWAHIQADVDQCQKSGYKFDQD